MVFKLKFSRSRGITLVELLVTLGLLSIISAFVTSFLLNLQRSYSLSTASNLQKSRDSRAINEIGKKINSSRLYAVRIAGASNADQFLINYFIDKINLPSSTNINGYNYSPVDIKSRILPELNSSMSFSPLYMNDTDVNVKFKPDAIGNSLFLATLEDTVNYRYTDSSGKQATKAIDLYQFHYYYLAKSNIRIMDTDDKRDYLFLMHWESQYYADYKQVKYIADATNSPGINTNSFFAYLSSSAAKAVNNKSIRIAGAWNTSRRTSCLTSADNNYIYGFTNTGFTDKSCTAGTKTIEMNSNKFYSLTSGYTGGKIYSIARNNQGNAESATRKVPTYASKTSSLNVAPDYYPHGFEVMMNGQAGSRKIFIRMLSKVSNPQGQSLVNEVTALFQGKDI